MKKIYIVPNINVTEIKMSHIICASNGTLSINPGDEITGSEGFGSRRSNSIWDDEDEEY